MGNAWFRKRKRLITVAKFCCFSNLFFHLVTFLFLQSSPVTEPANNYFHFRHGRLLVNSAQSKYCLLFHWIIIKVKVITVCVSITFCIKFLVFVYCSVNIMSSYLTQRNIQLSLNVNYNWYVVWIHIHNLV